MKIRVRARGFICALSCLLAAASATAQGSGTYVKRYDPRPAIARVVGQLNDLGPRVLLPMCGLFVFGTVVLMRRPR
jgi:hypothetical protein